MSSELEQKHRGVCVEAETSLTCCIIVYYLSVDGLPPCKARDKCGVNVLIDGGDGAS